MEESYLRAALSLVFVLGLLLGAGWFLRRFGDRLFPGRFKPALGTVRRLAIVESLHLDTQRRLVIVRRDAVEHLLVIGGPSGDLVVESRIAPTETSS